MYWFDDLTELYNFNKLHIFWPSKYISNEENVNALTRFFLYSGMILTLFNDNNTYILISLLIIFLMPLNISKSIKKPNKNNVSKSTNPLMKNVYQDCQKPSDDNPFANVMMNEYIENPERLPACFIEDVKDDVNEKFHKNLFLDIDSIYEKENSQRQFFTTANTTIPNDQVNFAKWLYMKDKNCKSNNEVCTGFNV